MTILIVDDDPAIRQLLTVFLEHNGYRTVSVANGYEALSYLQQSPSVPELILLDQMMPVMDGVAFRLAQQQDPQLATIPAVLLSAVDTIQVHAVTMVADAYLPKPIDFEALRILVEQYCRQSRHHGA
jgi:CheY-like chemotaxis protein